MINFTIPGTGSSGHLGGGMILAVILGPYASFHRDGIGAHHSGFFLC